MKKLAIENIGEKNYSIECFSKFDASIINVVSTAVGKRKKGGSVEKINSMGLKRAPN